MRDGGSTSQRSASCRRGGSGATTTPLAHRGPQTPPAARRTSFSHPQPPHTSAGPNSARRPLSSTRVCRDLAGVRAVVSLRRPQSYHPGRFPSFLAVPGARRCVPAHRVVTIGDKTGAPKATHPAVSWLASALAVLAPRKLELGRVGVAASLAALELRRRWGRGGSAIALAGEGVRFLGADCTAIRNGGVQTVLMAIDCFRRPTP